MPTMCRFRSAEESDFFVEPHVLVSDELVIKWGDVTLNISITLRR
jgi:hypothetical protein